MKLRLKDLMREYNLNPYELADKMNNVSFATIYDWLNEDCYPKLNNLIDLANIFECSIEYLIGRSEEIGNTTYKQPEPWKIQFRKILKQNNLTVYRLDKENIISASSVAGWLYRNNEIGLKNLIKLADYLQVDIDTLVGRI